MKVVFDQRFCDSSYAQDNAAMPGRMEAAMSNLGAWVALAPTPATHDQLSLAHDATYLEQIAQDEPRFAMACLAAGGAILAAQQAFSGEPTFACVRPPGHHASRSEAWGHCTFNNVALALLVLRAESRIGSAFVIDIDAHTGDGTRKLLASWPQAEVFNPFAATAKEYLELVEDHLATLKSTDIIAVSAGFDAYQHDVGHKLATADFESIGTLVRRASERLCRGR
ncbi:MAG: hypothetical protein Q8O00_08825, partial [Holophaga sp.]|nr:hypothetical protein [Holophaga sp.]